MPPLWLLGRVLLVLDGRLVVVLDGRLVVVPLPTRPLVPAVGLEPVVGLEVTCGRLTLPLGRPEVLPPTVGRLALIEPFEVRPDTVAPFCGLVPATRLLIEPPVPLLPCLTLAT